jgi:hypothetical protein
MVKTQPAEGRSLPAPAPAPEPPAKPAKKKRKPPERGKYVRIPCDVCGRQIATQAKSCPRCGAPNEWLHPEIRAFLREQRDYGFGIRKLKTEALGCVLTGVAWRPSDRIDPASVTAGLLIAGAVLWPVGLVALAGAIGASVAAGCVSEELRKAAGADGEAFIIDFRTEPPMWQSTNDDFWDEVMYFFDL